MLRANIQDITASCQLFVAPGGLGEIRVIGDGRTCGLFFNHDEIPQAGELAATMFPNAKGIYLVMNPIDRELSGRPRLVTAYELTENVHIVRRRWILVDFDPKRPTGVSATNEEKESARLVMEDCFEYLRSAGFPEPVFADSGNGWHMLFRVDLDPDDSGLIQAFLKALAKKYTTDAVGVDITVHNAARITKLYGTPACKGENTPERPHRLSKLLSVPDDLGIVPPELIQAVIDEVHQSATMPVTASVNGHATAPAILTNGFRLPATAGDGERHDTLKSLAAYLRVVGADTNEIFGTLQVFNRSRMTGGGKPDSELQSLATYYGTKDVNQPMQALLEGWSAESAEKAQQQQRLKLLLQDAQKKLTSGQDFEGVLAKLQIGLAEIKPVGTDSELFRSMTLGELIDNYSDELPPVIDSVARPSEVINLVNKAKTNKTWTAYSLAWSVIGGLPWFGRFACQPGRVLIVDNELRKPTLRFRLPCVPEDHRELPSCDVHARPHAASEVRHRKELLRPAPNGVLGFEFQQFPVAGFERLTIQLRSSSNSHEAICGTETPVPNLQIHGAEQVGQLHPQRLLCCSQCLGVHRRHRLSGMEAPIRRPAAICVAFLQPGNQWVVGCGHVSSRNAGCQG